MRFSESAILAASVEDSFDYMTDQAMLAEWNDHVQSAEVIGGEPVRVGSLLRQHRRRGNKEFDLTFEVIEHDRPHRHTVKGAVFGVETLMTFEFTNQATGTLITQTAEVSGKGLRAPLARAVAKEMRKSVVTGLEQLRSRLEGA
jgi:uncharacterized protein YndB with AHSA1/START domain